MKRILCILSLSLIIVGCVSPNLVSRYYSYNNFESFETALTTITGGEDGHPEHKYLILDPENQDFTPTKYLTRGNQLIGNKKDNNIMSFQTFEQLEISYSFSINEETKTFTTKYVARSSDIDTINNLVDIIDEVESRINAITIETIEQSGVDYYKIKLDEHPLLSIYFETEDENNVEVANEFLSNLKEHYLVLEFEAEFSGYIL